MAKSIETVSIEIGAISRSLRQYDQWTFEKKQWGAENNGVIGVNHRGSENRRVIALAMAAVTRYDLNNRREVIYSNVIYRRVRVEAMTRYEETV